MLDSLRKPFFIIALGIVLCVVLVEIGSPRLLIGREGDPDLPGYGIQYLVFVDVLLFYVTLTAGLQLIVPERIQGRVVGVVTLVLSVLGCLAIVAAILAAVVFLLLLVTLLLSPIFGTVAYFAAYGNFDRGGANLILSLIMMLKFAFVVLLLLSHQGFLKSKSLVVLIVTSFAASLIISFLLNFVPGFLVSITDALGAIIVAILALIWGIYFIIGSIISAIKAIH